MRARRRMAIEQRLRCEQCPAPATCGGCELEDVCDADACCGDPWGCERRVCPDEVREVLALDADGEVA